MRNLVLLAAVALIGAFQGCTCNAGNPEPNAGNDPNTSASTTTGSTDSDAGGATGTTTAPTSTDNVAGGSVGGPIGSASGGATGGNPTTGSGVGTGAADAGKAGTLNKKDAGPASGMSTALPSTGGATGTSTVQITNPQASNRPPIPTPKQ